MKYVQNPETLHRDAYREIDAGCSTAISACIDMMDAAAVIGVTEQLHAVRETLLCLHAVSTMAVKGEVGELRH